MHTNITTHYHFHFLALLNPLFTSVFTPPLVLFKSTISFIYFTFVVSIIMFLPMSFVFDYKKPFESFVNPAVFCSGFIFFTLSELSRLMFSFRFEPGRALMSGKKDSDDFMNDSFVFYVISDLIYVLLSLFFIYEEFRFISFVKSNPPPVWSYLRALLSSASFSFIYSCSFMYFFRAYSALFWVSLRFYSSSCSFLNFSSRSLFFYYSALLRRSSYLAFFSTWFFSVSSLSLTDF